MRIYDLYYCLKNDKDVAAHTEIYYHYPKQQKQKQKQTIHPSDSSRAPRYKSGVQPI